MKINKGYKQISSQRKIISLFFLLALYLLTRILYLDSDIPFWSISHYSPIDEFYYTATSFDIVEGIHSPNGLLLSPQGSAYNLFQQTITAFSLFIIGDNYYGLRLPAVLAGMIVIISFFWIVLQRLGLLSAVAFSVLLISEFSFSLATRISEPTIFRMAAAALLLTHFISNPEIKIAHKYFITGFLTGLSCYFVYPTNAFLLLLGLVYISISCKTKITKSISYYILGLISCLALYIIVIHYSLEYNFQDLINTKSIFSSRVSDGSDIRTLIEQATTKLLDLQVAKFFLIYPYSITIFTASLLIIVISFFFSPNGKKNIDYLIIGFLLCFIIQTAFINDYPQRKLVAALPALLYVCVLAAHLITNFFHIKIQKPAKAIIFLLYLYALATPTFNYIYSTPTYYYKEAMKRLTTLEDERIIGEWAFGFRLYNNYRPYLNKYTIFYNDKERYYRLLNEAGKNGDSRLTISYGNDETVKLLNSAGFKQEKIVLESRDPKYPDVYIYKYKNDN